ncbi:MAG: type III-B CRISPR module RAMP protein Cmr6 [Clostridia bacterium]|nr:type III-B CRISPR module RAMP protein Cmr6 [Clostridia bacterium]
MKNLNLLFNKSYYLNLGNTEVFKNDVFKYNNELINAVFDKNRDYVKSPVATETFVLKVAYPGLLVGSGNLHGAHVDGVNDDINIGFTFDFVTGQPIIPGSSIKGVLRSALEKNPDVVGAFFKIDFNGEVIKELFEQKDVFLDAVVYSGNKNNRLLDFDYITHHKDEIKNPIPIKFIKVIPDVQFEFRFKLTDGFISAKEKANLYKNLLMLIGAGAKTNVGYGVFLDVSSSSAPVNSVECLYCKTINNKYTKSGNTNNAWLSKNCYKCGKGLNI